MIIPSSLNPGDKILILSPASHIKHELVDGACEVIKSWGFEPIVSTYCKGTSGTYSGTIEERKEDLLGALADNDIKAILCSRGGYGVVHLLDSLSPEFLRKNAKWIIGFSDISALHSTMVTAGVCSLHAPMCKHLAELGADDACSVYLKNILCGKFPAYNIEPHPYNRIGTVTGKLIGGNMAVMCGLASTSVDFLKKDIILFIEDIGEAVYKIERMLYMLRLNGVLPAVKALIVGQFTEYKPNDSDKETMEEMIHRIVSDYDFPVAFNFPVGHVDYNLPLIEGADVNLSITEDAVTLTF